MIFSLRVYILKEKNGKSAKLPKNEKKRDLPFRDGISLVLSLDKEGKITKFNKECEEILGYTEKEALNQNIFDFLIPDHHHDQWRTLIDYSLRNKMVDAFQLPLLTKDGQEILVCWSNFPIKDLEGVVVDISLVGNVLKSLKHSPEEFPKHPDYQIQGFSIEEGPDTEILTPREHPVETIEKVHYIDEELERKKADYHSKDKKLGPKSLFGRKRRKQDAAEEQGYKKYDNKFRELDERESALNKLESKITKDKMKLKNQLDEFKKWREKLESLEEQLENKRQNLLGKEPLSEYIKGDVVVEPRKTLDKILNSAAIVQRGILKQVNGYFASLVGYDIDEIVEKSLFDFIIPEGFSDIEKYYLARLKGEDVSVYETVILTKDNEKIPVEVSTKLIIFNGAKAEIAVFKKIEK